MTIWNPGFLFLCCAPNPATSHFPASRSHRDPPIQFVGLPLSTGIASQALPLLLPVTDWPGNPEAWHLSLALHSSPRAPWKVGFHQKTPPCLAYFPFLACFPHLAPEEPNHLYLNFLNKPLVSEFLAQCFFFKKFYFIFLGYSCFTMLH